MIVRKCFCVAIVLTMALLLEACGVSRTYHIKPLPEPDFFIGADPVVVSWEKVLDDHGEHLGYLKTMAFRPHVEAEVRHYYLCLDYAYRQLGHVTQTGHAYRYDADRQENFIGRYPVYTAVAEIFGRETIARMPAYAKGSSE